MHSPCIRRCTLNHDDICMGCFRHLDEITGWQKASDAQQQEIFKRCAKRKNQYMEQILHYIR